MCILDHTRLLEFVQTADDMVHTLQMTQRLQQASLAGWLPSTSAFQWATQQATSWAGLLHPPWVGE